MECYGMKRVNNINLSDEADVIRFGIKAYAFIQF